MKVLLISENRIKENLIPYPLGIAYIAAACREAGHEVLGLDLMFSQDPPSHIAEAVSDFNPDCIGLSVRNIDNQDPYRTEFYLPQVKEIVETIRSCSGAPVILGGAGFTIFPLQCLEYLDLEMGVVGEGEVTFVKLLELLEEGRDPQNLPGLAIRREGEGRVNPGTQTSLWASPHSPDRDIFDVSPYNWRPGQPGIPYVANLQSRRGCPKHCIYCSSPIVEGNTLRLRDVQEVADEFSALGENHDIKFTIFTDSLFNIPPHHTRELCEAIIRRGSPLEWGCIFYPSREGISLMEKMREAGCMSLSLGNESGSDLLLERWKKGFTKMDARHAIEEAQRVGLRVNCFLLLGGPGETRRTVEESVDFLLNLSPETVTVTVGMRIYPGCELHAIALQEGVISPQQNLLYPAFYISPEVEPWLYEHMLNICSQQPGWSL